MVVNEYKGNLTSAVRGIVLEAWRERWSEEKWAKEMKKYLPLIDRTDHGLLSNILLEQATISASPSIKLLEYLKYAILTQMTSFSMAVQNMVVHKDISRPYCLAALIEFLSTIFKYPFFNESTEDPMELSKALMSAKLWLFEIMSRSLSRLTESKCPVDVIEELLKSSSSILSWMSKNEVCESLVCLAMLDSEADSSTIHLKKEGASSSSYVPNGNIQKLEHLSAEIGRLLGQPINQSISDEVRQTIIVSTKFEASNLRNQVVAPARVIDSSDQYLNTGVNLLIVMETYLFPCNNVQVLAEKLVTLEQLQRLDRTILYREILRSCYLGLLDENVKPEDIKWSTFVSIRLPSLFLKLSQSSPSEDKQAEFFSGIELLLDFVYLLDAVDTKFSFDCLQFLLNEFMKLSLLNESQVRKITSKRQSTTLRLIPSDASTQGTSSTALLILKTEITLATLLMKLENNKSPDVVASVMNPLICGKSFEAVSVVAAATGRLQSFIVTLIRINEGAKMTSMGEMAKFFDASFVFLCHIIQTYGLEVVSSCTECSSSFFYQWATRSLVDGAKSQSLADINDLSVDPKKVETLLNQLVTGGDFKTSFPRWSEVCHLAPYAIQELLRSWQSKKTDQDTVRNILDTLKSSMCCLAVVVATWLCNIVQWSEGESKQMIIFMLQQLSTYNNTNNSNNNSESNLLHYTERAHFARQFIYSLSASTVPRISLPTTTDVNQQSSKTSFSLPRDALASADVQAKFSEVFQEVQHNGCINVEQLLTLERIFESSSSYWFCFNIVKEIGSFVGPQDLLRAVCVAHSFFQIDLEELTACFVGSVLPNLLLSSGQEVKYLTDPTGRAITKLLVLNVASLYRIKQFNKESEARIVKRKRKRADYLTENSDDVFVGDIEKQCKIKRENEAGQDGATSSLPLGDNFLLGDVLCSHDQFNPSNPSSLMMSTSVSNVVTTFRDPLAKHLTGFLSLCNEILMDSCIGPQTEFVLNFIRELLKTGTTISRYVLLNAPPNFVQTISKYIHDEITPQQIFMFCDVSTHLGRSAAAKAVCQAVKQTSAKASQPSFWNL